MKKKLEKIILWAFGISGFLIAISLLIMIGVLFLSMIIEDPGSLGPILVLIIIFWTVFGTIVFLALMEQKHSEKSPKNCF